MTFDLVKYWNEVAAKAGLSEEQRLRWLARVDDDLVRALRSAAAAGAGEQAKRRTGPAW